MQQTQIGQPPLGIGAQQLIRILIVENDNRLRQDYRRYISDYEEELRKAVGGVAFQIQDAGTAKQAKRYLEGARKAQQPFDLMFLDLEIPEEKESDEPLVDVGLELGRIAQETGSVKRTILLSGKLLDPDTTKFIVKGEGVQEEIQNKIYDFVHNEGEKEFRSAADAKSTEILAQRIQRLAPYAERSFIYSFGLCFSRCLQEVDAANSGLQNELLDRFGLDYERDADDSVVKQLHIMDQALRNGRQNWAELQNSLSLASLGSPRQIKVREVIEKLREEFIECLKSKDVSLDDYGTGDETVVSFNGDVDAILSEIILGALGECERIIGSRSSRQEMRFSSQTDEKGKWVEVILQDNLKRLSLTDVKLINEGRSIHPESRFSRAWGLSVMQHAARLGGGRLIVEIDGAGNKITYRIPRALTGGEREAVAKYAETTSRR